MQAIEKYDDYCTSQNNCYSLTNHMTNNNTIINFDNGKKNKTINQKRNNVLVDGIYDSILSDSNLTNEIDKLIKNNSSQINTTALVGLRNLLLENGINVSNTNANRLDKEINNIIDKKTRCIVMKDVNEIHYENPTSRFFKSLPLKKLSIGRYENFKTIEPVDKLESEDDDDVICSLCFDENISNLRRTECDHDFCKKCLVKILRNKFCCPMCKKNMSILSSTQKQKKKYNS